MHQRLSASRWLTLTDDYVMRVTHLCDRRAGNTTPCAEENVPDTVCFARAHRLREGTSVEDLNRIEDRTAAAGIYGAAIAVGAAPVMLLAALALTISGDVQRSASLALAAGVLGAVSIVHAVLAVAGETARLLTSRLLGGDSAPVAVASAERVAEQVRILDRQGALERGADVEHVLDAGYRALGSPRASASEIAELLESPVLDRTVRRSFPAGR